MSHSRALRLKNDDNVKVTSPHKNLTACDLLWISQLIQALCDAYHQKCDFIATGICSVKMLTACFILAKSANLLRASLNIKRIVDEGFIKKKIHKELFKVDFTLQMASRPQSIP